jgi:glycosidase
MSASGSWGFPFSKSARRRLDHPLGLVVGPTGATDLLAARRLAAKLGVSGADLVAAALVNESLRIVAQRYGEQAAPTAFGKAVAALEQLAGRETVGPALDRMVEAYGPEPAAAPDQSAAPAAPAAGAAAPSLPLAPARVLEEMLHVWLTVANPACGPLAGLFDTKELDGTRYRDLVDGMGGFFAGQPVFGPDNEDLVTLLRSPAVAFPDSLREQLEYIRRKFGSLLGDLLPGLLTGLDLLREQERLGAGAPGPVVAGVPTYDEARGEAEAFSADRDWMPRVVMIAKNALVWLDRLSRAHGRPITRLDQVPDEELDTMARRGFTALWLIGVWERSAASRTIKRRMGNAEAEASAYALADYAVAAALGGEAALADLGDRAWRRGIRLASDMVPNHTGIDSHWVVEHPERFLAWPFADPPYPSYSFTGPDLSSDPRVGVFIEDHYWDRTDAAVVFKRVDRSTGETRYLYHGNDGTHMPWNDTAQLDFLREDTREAVIRTILHVARLFPIIRFDAAMTLTRRHYQRLWFPEPGRGGDIPSRAGNGLSREEFNRRMPVEFWREVVDRAAAERPDTLLLAEAFWLLEGYFVRTLGMHRVYNSAFMNMLKTEDNAGFRLTIRNTLEFDPGVLERFVNFMSNPDEQTAEEQFGSGEKYLGVATMLATLPGLPMFAHGQVEGFREKYGMEFTRAFWNEEPDQGLVERHERFVFPLLRRRHLFARAERFRLYDLFAPEGWVNEDVFAYSNGSGSERALVLYNNAPHRARGWIRESAAFAEKTPGGKRLARCTLAEGLGIGVGNGRYTTFREHGSGLEYLRSSREIAERGLAVDLAPYGCQVFLDFAEVAEDSKGSWSRLCAHLGGTPVPSLGRALRELELAPVRDAFHDVLIAIRDVLAALRDALGSPDPMPAVSAFGRFADAAEASAPGSFDAGAGSLGFGRRLRAITELARLPAPGAILAVPDRRAMAAAWIALAPLGTDAAGRIDEWLLGDFVRGELLRAGCPPGTADAGSALLALLLAHPGALADRPPAFGLLSAAEAEPALRVNTFDGVRWFDRERFELLADTLAVTAGAAALAEALAGEAAGHRPAGTPAGAVRAVATTRRMLDAARASAWRWDDFRAAWQAAAEPKARTRTKARPASGTKRLRTKPPRAAGGASRRRHAKRR